ncbi:MAG: SDR family oxidoreductase [Candidatus Bathyarchaeia archaeon]
MAPRVMITGSTGRLGKELLKVFPDSFAPRHEELDIINKEAVFDFIKNYKPEVLIHCAALTGIRECEENKLLAWRINVEGTENLVRACESFVRECYFVYISTACVFYGDKGDYVETDIPYPKNFYSLTKLLGEFVVKYSNLKKWLIIRTNFVAREKWPYPKAFVDRFGTYLFADDLARAIKNIVEEGLTGILHVCGEEKLSMFELAKITTPEVQPMTLKEYNGPPLTVDMSLRSIRIKPFKLTRGS